MKNWKTLHLAIEQDGSTSDTFFFNGKQKGKFPMERNTLCYTEVITVDWKEDSATNGKNIIV
jgi:hypothetical protein